MFNNIYKKIYNKIKKYDNIIIARHIGADPDALGSQIGLRDIILNTFPHKKVYAVGLPSSKFKYLGSLDKIDEIKSNSLLIVLDTPDLKRVDGINISDFKDSIKIDHHPFIEKFCTLEWIDDTASSASQMIIELVFNTKLKLSREAAEKLYMGLVSDTNRFMFSYTSSKTFDLISKLINFLFKRYKQATNYSIIGFAITSTLLLLKEVLNKTYKLNEIILGIILFIIGFIIVHFLEKKDIN